MTETWFDTAFPRVPWAPKKQPGSKTMLILIGYDICDHKRLAKIAKICEDYGMRVQLSLFECYLEEDEFSALWEELLEHIDPAEDRLVAYRIDAASAKHTKTAGTMTCSEKVVCYLL